MCPPRAAVPEECIKVEDFATSLFRRDGLYIAQLLKGNYFTNAARSRITTNLEQEVRDYACTFMYPEENTLTESTAASCSTGERDFHSSTSGHEELDDSEDEDECQLHSKITVLNTYFQYMATNAFCRQTFFLKQKESL